MTLQRKKHRRTKTQNQGNWAIMRVSEWITKARINYPLEYVLDSKGE